MVAQVKQSPASNRAAWASYCSCIYGHLTILSPIFTLVPPLCSPPSPPCEKSRAHVTCTYMYLQLLILLLITYYIVIWLSTYITWKHENETLESRFCSGIMLCAVCCRWRLKACDAPSRTWVFSSPQQLWLTPPSLQERASATQQPGSTTPLLWQQKTKYCL